MKYNVLIMGASYGSLLAAKLLLAGHNVRLVCLPDEAKLINEKGIRVRMPIRGREGLAEIDSGNAPGMLSAGGTEGVNPNDYHLVVLAMQEPQYRVPGVRDLLDYVARSSVPCMSIMNMPPLPYLKRLPGVDADKLRNCYTDPKVWDNFDPERLTLASPDPQAFRPPDEPVNVLQVSLPTNFKVARFTDDKQTAILRQLEQDIMDIRFECENGDIIELPVKLKVHDSVFVPLAKWAMLLTGNYRCVLPKGARSIKDAVNADLEASRSVYEWVCDLCKSLGANDSDMVPFQKYADAAQGLEKPSSAARALENGAPYIERLDLVVKTIADGLGMHSPSVDETVATVDQRLSENRKQAA